MTNSVVKRIGTFLRGKPVFGLSLVIAALAGGCSADISRFNLPSSLSLNDEPGSNTTGALAAPTEPVRERSNLIGSDGGPPVDTGPQPSNSAYYPPRSERPGDVRMSALPETAPSLAAPSYAPAPAPLDRPAPDAGQYNTAATQGETIDVQQGDTLYGLSKRHHVSLAELMAVNDLKGPNLKPGQKLVLPAQKPAREAALRPADTVMSDARPATLRPNSTPVAITPEPAPSDWSGTYVVKSGDSLYSIARANKIKFTELQKYNGVQDVRRVKPGTMLKVPAGAGNTFSVAPPPETGASASNGSPPVQQPTTILNQGSSAEKRVVAVNQTNSATDASPAPSGSGSVGDNSKLRWPAQGKVIAGFGQRPDGTHNDGVNLAVPLGTEIHAADGGVVAYAGNELKGYGNLILLRHDNGWVTAYAHSDELMVKRGDKVRRGQVIAKAGKTGQVDQPQVHFELRQGQRPVDPTPHMEKL